MYKVSILVPIFGVEQFIERCARSLFEQTYQDIEYVFVNDCSPDRSVEILKKVLEDYPERRDDVKIIDHDKNRGLSAARNTAVEYATGLFLSHVDSDDWVEPQMIEYLVRTQLDTNADIVSCNAVSHYPTGETVLEEPDYKSKDEMMQSVLRMTLDHVIWRRLIRMSLYKANKVCTVEGVNIGEDHYTLPRLLYYADSFAKCNRVLYHYNCLNGLSYMRSTQESFSFPRYKSNISSFDILIDFFTQKAPNYLSLLYEEKSDYVYGLFFVVLKIGNKDAYERLCLDWKSIDNTYKRRNKKRISSLRIRLLSPLYYTLNRLRVFCRIMLKKTMGIKCYEL